MSKLNTSEKNLLIKKFENGASVTELSKSANISRTTLYNWINEYKTKSLSFEKHKLSSKNDKLSKKLEVLSLVNCSVNSPLREKLYELEKLDGKFSVYVLCEALNVDRGTYYNHLKRNKKDNSSYKKRKEELSKLIIQIFHETNEIFGADKIAAILNNKGISATPKYVNKIMKENNLVSIRTNSKQIKKSLELKKDLLNRNFKPIDKNLVWASDITYISFNNKFYYLCVILDLYSRKVIAYKFSDNQSVNLVTSAFKSAFESRDNPKGLIFHSDRGSQYSSKTFTKLLKDLNIRQSFSPSGKPTYNAVVESFFSSLKQEELYRKDYQSKKEMQLCISEYISFYNNVRPHKFLNYKTPNNYED